MQTDPSTEDINNHSVHKKLLNIISHQKTTDQSLNETGLKSESRVSGVPRT